RARGRPAPLPLRVRRAPARARPDLGERHAAPLPHGQDLHEPRRPGLPALPRRGDLPEGPRPGSEGVPQRAQVREDPRARVTPERLKIYLFLNEIVSM